MWLEFVPAVSGPQATPAPDTGAAQGAAVQAAFADEALLASLTDYDQFADYPSDYQTQLVFTADAPVSDFRFLALTLRDVGADGTMYYDTEDLYTTDALAEGKPVVIRMTFAGDVPDRGIAYTDCRRDHPLFCHHHKRRGRLAAADGIHRLTIFFAPAFVNIGGGHFAASDTTKTA